jgi:hypothetical protein
MDASKDIASLSGIDILGFTPEQWQNTFDNLDGFSNKIAAVELAMEPLKCIWYIFSILDWRKRTLQKFEANNRKNKLT